MNVLVKDDVFEFLLVNVVNPFGPAGVCLLNRRVFSNFL